MVRGISRHRMSSCVIALVSASALFAASTSDTSNLAQARKLYQFTDYQGSLRALQRVEPKDGPALELIGRNHFMLGEYKKASEFLEKAAAADPENSDYQDWLGRAFGRRAETSSPFTAPALANKARQHFEKAVQLEPAKSRCAERSVRILFGRPRIPWWRHG